MKKVKKAGYKMKIPLLRVPYDEADINFIKDGVEEVLKSGYLTMGTRVKEFEEKFADFCGVKYAVATNSGTSSIEIILRAIGIEGSTVIVPSNTYMATPIAVVKAGGRVIFAECRKDDLQLDPDDIEKKIQPDTKGVIIVHIGGIISPHMDRIKKICEEKGLFLIEDAAHAHGATIDGNLAGSLSLAGSFSFYPTKVFTTAEGGMMTTDSEEIYKKALVLREHGKADHDFNVHTEFGDNWRFSEIHAILGLREMNKADWILNERRRVAKYYDENLKGVEGIRLLDIPSNINPSYYKYILYLDERIKRDQLKPLLKEKFNVSLTGEVYSDPCHTQPVFEKYPDKMANPKGEQFPSTDYVCRQHICLPLYPGLTEEETGYVVSSLKEALDECLSDRR
jgi:perosamine synthetase